LIAAYHMLIRREPFHDLGTTYLDERNATKVVNRLTRRIERLGYQVTVQPQAAIAP
jgi:transposase